jgi:hypothetical protein
MTPFCGGLKNIWSGAKNTKRSKKLQTLRMTILGEFWRKNIPNKLALMGQIPRFAPNEQIRSGIGKGAKESA